MAVDITLEARDRISQQIDAITKNLNSLNSAFQELENVSSKAGNSAKASLDKISSAASSVGKGLTTVGSGLTKYVTKPAIAAGAALGGLVLAKGFSRFAKIDEARAKLTALGHTGTAVDKIMDNALQSVLGTAYNLDEAGTTAAGAVAAGIKPGKDLTKYLSTVTDAAAIAGVGMDEMGTIFNRVAANGKVTTMEMNQLADRGVPIWQYMSKETGKSVEDVRKAISAGEVDLQTFRNAIANNIGGAAKEMGKISWAGMVSNLEASMGRIGANIWGATDDVNSLSHVLLELGNDAMAPLEKVELKAKEFGQTLGGTARLLKAYFSGGISLDLFAEVPKGARDLFTQIQPAVAKVKELADAFAKIPSGKKIQLAGLSVGLGPALKIAGKLSTTFGTMAPKIAQMVTKAGGLKGIFSALTGPIGIVTMLFAGMFANSEKFREATATLFESLGPALSAIFSSLGPLLSSVFSTLSSVLGTLGDLFAPIITAAAPVLTSLTALFSAVVGAITPIINAILELVGWFGEKLSGPAQAVCEVLSSVFGGVQAVIDAVTGAVNALKNAWDSWKPSAKNLTVNRSESITGSPAYDEHHATGTKSAPGGTALVGERGPELVNLPKGASVHTARDTEQMMNNRTVNMPINVTMSDGGMDPDQLISYLSQKLSEVMSAGAEGVIA